MCAGQGRDLIGVARRHRRGHDLTGLLVEADPRNVAAARDAIARAGLHGLTVHQGDAGDTAAYQGAEPAALLLACGIFGNVTNEDVHATVRYLPSLCAPGARVLWTRGPRGDILATIQRWFEEAGFQPDALIVPDGGLFGVGAARLVTPAPPSPAGSRKLFTFVQ